MKYLRLVPFAILALGMIPIAHADTVTLPLQGFFHPGRAIPIRWETSLTSSSADIQFSAAGALTTHIPAPDPQGVAPCLIIDRDLTAIHWTRAQSTGSLPLQSIPDSEKIVGTTLDNPALVHRQFFGQPTLSIHLDPDHPIDGPACAWQSLDALLLSPSSYARLTPDQLRDLYAQGVQLAVESAEPPDNHFPWRQQGRLWIAKPELLLPAAIDPSAYNPTLGWAGGRSYSFRLRIIFQGVIITLLLAAVGLWRTRYMPIAALLLAAVACPLLIYENHTVSPIAYAWGDVHIAHIQDTWLYQLTHRSADFQIPLTRVNPIFVDLEQVNQIPLTLDCDSTGNPISLAGTLPPDVSLTLLIRTWSPAQSILQSTQPNQFISTPLRTLVPDLYPGYTLAAQTNDGKDFPTGATRWPSLTLQPLPAP